MMQMIEFLVTPEIQGVLGIVALLSAIIMLFLNSKMGEKDERIKIVDLEGTNVVLWVFVAVIAILFFVDPSEAQIYRSFILDATYIAIIAGGGYSIYQYKKYQ